MIKIEIPPELAAKMRESVQKMIATADLMIADLNALQAAYEEEVLRAR